MWFPSKLSKHFYILVTVVVFYLIIIHSAVIILYQSGNLYLKETSNKEIIFGMWGYAWDGMHYLKIATEGYRFPLQAFFPFYPIVLWCANLILPLTLTHRINLVLIFVAVFLMNYLLKINDIPITKRRISIALFLSVPSAFFLIANYNETLYIILASLILINIQKGKLLRSSVLGALLSATKITGVIMPFIYLYEFLRKRKYTIKSLSQYLMYSFISISGALFYLFYLNTKFGTWTVFLRAQKEWNRTVAPSQNFATDLFNKYLYPSQNEIFRIYLELGVFIFLIFSLVYLYKKMPRAIWIYSLMHILVPVSTGSLLSLPRLSLLAFPIYLWIFAKVGIRLGIIIGVILLSIQIYTLYLFYNNVFIG